MATGYLGSSGINTYFKDGPVSLNVTMPANTYPNGTMTLDNMGMGQAYWDNGHIDAHAMDMYLCDANGNNAVYLFTVALAGTGGSTSTSGTSIVTAAAIAGIIAGVQASGGSTGNVKGTMAYIPNTATVSGAQGLAGKALYIKAVGDSMSLNRLRLRNRTNVTIATTALENSITCNVSGGHGTLSANKTKAAPGTTVTLTPNPATGYEVDTITTSPSVTITNNKFTMPSSAITVTATFKQINYTITKKVSPSGAGTVTASSTAHYGDTVAISQQPASDAYYFKNWTISPSLTISGGQFTMPAQNVTVTANYLRRSTASLNKTTLTGGGTATLTINSESSAYTHKYKLSFGTGMETSLTAVAAGVSSVSISIPSSWSNQVPNAETKTGGTLIVETYSGSTKIGTYTISGLTFAVPSSAVPVMGTITKSIARTIGGVTYADVGEYYVQNHSGVRVQASATAQLGASISSMKVELVGYSGSAYSNTVSAASIDFTTGLLQVAGTAQIKVTATDSRGRKTISTTTITVTAYNAPSGTLTVNRADAAGQEDPTGTKGIYEITKSFTAIGSNSLTVTMTSQGTTVTQSNDTGDILPGSRQDFIVQNEYIISITLTDAFETVTIQARLRSAQFIIFVNANGDKIGFMKAANKTIPSGKTSNFEIDASTQVWIGDSKLEDLVKSIIESKIKNVLNSTSTTDALSAAQGKALAEGSARDSTKVAKAGDTMTGNLTFSGDGKGVRFYGASTTFEMIKFVEGTSAGHGMVMGGGGLVVMGSGESASAIAEGKAGNSEYLYLGSDNHIYLMTNCNTFANAKTFTFSSGGIFTAPDGLYLGSQNMGKAVKSISRSGNTFTATCCDGTTFTFTQQNTWRAFSVSSYNYSYTISANSTLNITGTNFGVSTPSGYTAVAVQQWQSGNDNVVVAGIRCQYTGSDWVMKLRNTSSSSQSGKAYINILYLQN